MQFGGLASCKVVAGDRGLDNQIESITVMEVPDVVRWLNGNVLLLSSLYPIKDDEEAIRSLVPQLAAAGNSALAIKTQTYVDKIPVTIIDAGNRLNFPIIEIPSDMAYLEIMTPLMEPILKRVDTGKSRLEDFYQWIKELALGGKGIPALTEAIEQMTGNLITVGSELSSLELFQGMDVIPLTRAQHSDLKAAKRPIRMQRVLNHKQTSCIVAPLLLNEEVWGDITCWQTTREFMEQDFQVLDRAMMLIALEFLKAITKHDLEQALKDHFLTDILLSRRLDITEVIEKAKMFGWDFSQSYQVVCIRIDEKNYREEAQAPDEEKNSERNRRILYKLNSIFRFDSQQAIVTLVNDLIVILFSREIKSGMPLLPYMKDPLKDNILHRMDHVRDDLIAAYDDALISIGIGRFYVGLDGMHRGYEEATKAIQYGKPWGQNGAVHFEDLGIYRVLHAVQDHTELKSLQAETIGKLAAYDSIHESELLFTLKQYFENNGSVSETAKKLFVHVNTIKYRLQKIEQITACSVHNAEQQLLLHIGLKIHGMLEVEQPC